MTKSTCWRPREAFTAVALAGSPARPTALPVPMHVYVHTMHTRVCCACVCARGVPHPQHGAVGGSLADLAARLAARQHLIHRLAVGERLAGGWEVVGSLWRAG
jgi:hypothetical protein